jgi:hypothetical protein
MIMTTVIAVALGFAPVRPDGTVEAARDNYAHLVGPYSERIDRHGRNHVSGFNRLTGEPYDLIVDKDGNVEGSVGHWVVSLHVTEPS